ncbi:DUF3500 domain-containing protein [Flavobacterium restrictum]|uniref:DUF3500 domain-containing protein n=1 Tax=Flavobacterium restrictum TaxID=2594428 RepID=A0A553DRV6_9FLAO|nr:DUF3500 domain-containing protein [Flavobacterium restrictum]TRX35400.1 DUF3500 domain-containing protein [Flavobacterium restrictum]
MKKTKLILLGAMAFLLTIVIACSKDDDSSSSSASVTALTSESAVFSATATINVTYSGTATLPYTGGNGATYSAGTAVASTGVTGLTATLVAGTLANGAGNLTYTITGTPTSSGTASFVITFGGQTVTITLTVNAASTTSCSSATGITKLICLCDALKASLTSTQVAAMQISYAYASIIKWSNFPDAIYGNRVGLKLSGLTTAQKTLVLALLQEISGSTSNEGYEELVQLLAADNYLGGSDYGEAYYHIAILGTPASTGTFEIYFGGHHTQLSNTYVNGSLVGATPSFRGVEPCTYGTSLSFSKAVNSSSTATAIIPMNQEATAFNALLTGLSSTNLATAKQSTTYSDIVCGPQKDWSFPTTKLGVKGSAMTSTEQGLMLAAIKTYVNDLNATDAAAFITLYTNELSDTYVAYSGSTGLATKYDYLRIDGPHVWIEYSVGSSIVLSSPATHPHSVWRDRTTDYGGTKQ